MNKYKNFLLESIYDIDVLKNLDLGQKNNKEIFSESRSMKKNMLAGTAYGDPSKGGIMFAGKPGSFVGSKGGTPAPAPTPPKGLIKVKSLDETKTYNFVNDCIGIGKKFTKDTVLSGLTYKYNKTSLNPFDHKAYDSEMSSLASKIKVNKGEADSAIRTISHILVFNYLITKIPGKVLNGSKNTMEDFIEGIMTSKSFKDVSGFVKSYYVATTIGDKHDFDLTHIKSINPEFNGKKITVENINAFKTNFEKEIEKKYDLT